jgi:hypothetical protein
MSKSNGRRQGSSTRTVMTGGKPAPLQKSIYGSTPKERVGGNTSSLFGKKLPGCSPATHIIGAPREK